MVSIYQFLCFQDVIPGPLRVDCSLSLQFGALVKFFFSVLLTSQAQHSLPLWHDSIRDPRWVIGGGLIFTISSNLFETLILPLCSLTVISLCSVMSSATDRFAHWLPVAATALPSICNGSTSRPCTEAVQADFQPHSLQDLLLESGFFSTPVHFLWHI